MTCNESLTPGKISVLALAVVALATAVSAASATAGMATLNTAGYSGYTETNEAAKAAASGTAIVTTGLLFLKITSTVCCAAMGLELEANKNGAEPVFGSVISLVAGMLVGHTMLYSLGVVKELGLGQALAASAVGGAEMTGGALLLSCCGCCTYFANKGAVDEWLERTLEASHTTVINQTAVPNFSYNMEEGRAIAEVPTTAVAVMTQEWDRRNQQTARAVAINNDDNDVSVITAYAIK